ncbi:endonuclease/exonuclease/phosphatase family protein [Fulvivirgaceae bacterium LMO-SS25]
MRFLIQFIFLLSSIIIYAFVFVPPDVFALAAIICLAIPFLLIIHIIWIVLGISKGIKSIWGNLISLLIGIPFLVSSFGLSVPSKHEGQIHILSYNLYGYRVKYNLQSMSERQAFLQWTIDHEAPIKVFQEFYTHRGHPNMDSYKKLIAAGYNGYFEPLTINNRNHDIGLAIFSKYPIINTGKLLDNSPSLNNIIFADLVIETDTIRIYNSHFQSMGIDPAHVMETEELKNRYSLLKQQLENGAVTRASQVKIALEHAKDSPYPIIFAGDFNDTPYSFSYRSFRSEYENAFEEKGNGFGFSMNSKLFFLRIDNIFISDEFTTQSFETKREVKYSDHFPIEASFRLRSNR